MKIIFFLVAHLSLSVFAKDLSDVWRVSSMQYRADQKDYRVVFKTQSGIYFTKDDAVKNCLMTSIEKKVNVKVVYDSKDLKIKDCHLLK